MTGSTDNPASHVPITDRGFAYGDGLFETLLVEGGRARRLDAHLDRLCRGCVRFGLADPGRETLRAAVTEAIQAAPDPAVVKLLVTRAGEGRGYRPPEEAAVRIHTAVSRAPMPDPDALENGIDLPILTTRLPIDPTLAGLKHRNRLHQVLASAELAGYREGLMLDRHARVVEGTRSNVFCVRGDVVSTPRLGEAGVAGVMRDAAIIWLRAAGLTVHESDLFPTDLACADEVFVTNAIIGVWPVRRLVGPPDATFTPGPHAFELRAGLAAEAG